MDTFKPKDIALKAQKKLLSRMSNKNTAKVFIEGRASNLLDNTYKLFKSVLGNKKEAEKLMKYIIKTVVKIGVLYRGDHFNEQELNLTTKLKSSFHKISMTVVSFYELDFSYDRAYLVKILDELRTIVVHLIENHLTDKSVNRVNTIFQICTKPEFLDSVFRKDSPHKDILGKIATDLNEMLEEEGLK